VEQELLRRAKDLLVLAAESEKEPEKLREQLARCQEDVAVFASIFKAAFRNNSRFDFAELKGVSFETLKGSELSETDREQMLIIARENWKKTPGLLPTVIGSLEKAVSSSKNIFRVLRKDGKVIAYIRSERLSTDEVYAGSANVAKEYQKSAIGDALFASSLDEDAKENIVYGNAHIDSHIGMTYVERYGFVIDGIEEVETESGIDYGFKIVRDDSVNPNYRSRQTKNPAEAAVFQMPEVRIRLVELVKKETAVGRVGTRFYSEPENPKKVFIVFEDRVQARKKAA
jgi:hypothetical protein